MLVHKAMHEYQRKALKFSLENRDSYQSLDLGLGKTLVALMWIRNIKAKGVLVVGPIKVMYNTWPEEIKKWTPNLTYAIVHGPDKRQALLSKVDVYLTSFSTLIWLFKTCKGLKHLPFDAIIIDEGSKIKAHNTKMFKALRAMADLFPKGKIILSGTPAPNSLLNLWSQYFFLDGGIRLEKAYTRYQLKYFENVDKDGRVWVIKAGAAPIIHERIRDITYRLEGTDYIKLPGRIDNFIKLRLPESVRKKYDELEQEFFLELDSGNTVELFNKMGLSMKLRQIVQGAVYTDKLGHFEELHTEKVEALQELMEINEGKPVLCAIQFIFELELIRRVFPTAPVIRGGVSNDEATRLIGMWNQGKIPLLLCHPQSLSHGMNLQSGGNIVLWFALPWSGDVYEQFIGRLKRQGQTADNVIVHHLVMQKTVDTAIAMSLKNKAKGQRALLDYLNKYHKGELEGQL